MAPMVSHLHELGLIEARAYSQTEVFAAGVEFARVEGIVPAPEANHAVKAAIDEAIRCREEGVVAGDPLQPLRARPLRHAGVHRLRRGQALRRRTTRTRSRWRSRGFPPWPAEGPPSDVDDAEHACEQEHVQPDDDRRDDDGGDRRRRGG